MKPPTFRRRLKHLRKTFAVLMAADKALEDYDDSPGSSFNERFYDLAFDAGFRAACTVMTTPVREGESLPKPDMTMTPMQFANHFADALLVNYYKRAIR